MAFRVTRRARLRLRGWGAALIVIGLLSAASRARADGGPAMVVTRDIAVQLGAERGPGVAVERAPRAAAAEASRAANPLLLTPPRVTVEAGRREGDFGSGLELRVTAIEDVPTRRYGAARARAAGALEALTERNVTLARHEAAARAAIAWATVLEAKEVLRLRSDALRDAEALVALARARVTSGVGMPLELAGAQGERGAAIAGVLDGEGLLTEALAELRFAAGLDAAAPVDAAGNLEAFGEVPSDDRALVTQAEAAHPQIATATSRATLAREEEKVAYARASPAFGIGANYTHEGTGQQVVSGVVVLPIPIGDLGGYDRARQRVNADVADAEVGLERQRIARDIRMALHERVHAREVHRALVDDTRTPLREALRLAQAEYQAGTGALAAVLLARTRLLTTEEQIVRSAADVQRADIRLARAAGTLLTSGAPRGGTP